jgi:BioD-like phosphotransacetylase family protein
LLKKLYLMGESGSGKTAIALSFALHLQEKGLQVAYFKPKTAARHLPPNQDADAYLMKRMLALPWETEQVAPLNFESIYIFGPSEHIRLSTQKMIGKLEKNLDEMSANTQTVLIEGGKHPGECFSLSLDDLSLAAKWQTPVVLVSKLKRDTDLDRLLFYNDLMQSRGVFLLGNIFNNIPQTILNKAREVYRPLLEEKGYRLLGIIPAQPIFTFPTVAEFCEALRGEILTGEEHLNLQVEEIVVGTMTIEGALRFLRRAINKAVITGGDRSDMALTALETSISALILTGGLYPDIRVITRAREKNVPVLLVQCDTYTTIGLLQGIVRQIRPEDTPTIAQLKAEVIRHCPWERIVAEAAAGRGFSHTWKQ